MNGLTLNVGLAVVWALLLGSPSPRNLAVGFGLGLLILRLFPHAAGTRGYAPQRLDPWPSLRRGAGWLAFSWFFLRELAAANVQVALLALRVRPPLNPLIVRVPLRVSSDGALTLLAATITLLPGTVAMGLSADRRVLYAHAIGTAHAQAARESIVRVEDRLLRLLEPAALLLPPPAPGGAP